MNEKSIEFLNCTFRFLKELKIIPLSISIFLIPKLWLSQLLTSISSNSELWPQLNYSSIYDSSVSFPPYIPFYPLHSIQRFPEDILTLHTSIIRPGNINSFKRKVHCGHYERVNVSTLKYTEMGSPKDPSYNGT